MSIEDKKALGVRIDESGLQGVGTPPSGEPPADEDKVKGTLVARVALVRAELGPLPQLGRTRRADVGLTPLGRRVPLPEDLLEAEPEPLSAVDRSLALLLNAQTSLAKLYILKGLTQSRDKMEFDRIWQRGVDDELIMSIIGFLHYHQEQPFIYAGRSYLLPLTPANLKHNLTLPEPIVMGRPSDSSEETPSKASEVPIPFFYILGQIEF